MSARAERQEATRPELRDVEDRLYQVWHVFELSSKTAEDSSARRSALFSLGQRLTDTAKAYLSELVELEVNGEKQIMERGFAIRTKAENDAKEVKRTASLEARMQREEVANMSKGEKLAIQRQKAHARRGTNPKLIH